MRITIDTETQGLQVIENGTATEYSLFSPEAFRVLSRHWLSLGWSLGHWSTFSWMGRQVLQLPDDVLRLGEMFWSVRPDVIVETGVYDGGCTLLFAALCRMQGAGSVISIDQELRPGVAEAIQKSAGDLVTLIEGDSASAETARQVQGLIQPADRVCVFLDSDHAAQHVAAELRHYGPLVSPGCYLVVADSICPDLDSSSNGESAWTWDNPASAVDEFLEKNPDFTRERPAALFPSDFDFTELSYFPRTWLRRK